MTNLRTAQVATAVASLALLGFDLVGWLRPDSRVAALGARFGLTAIPNRWRNAVAQLRQNRTPSSTTPTSWSSNRPLLPHRTGSEIAPLCMGRCPRKRTGGRTAANCKTSNELALC